MSNSLANKTTTNDRLISLDVFRGVAIAGMVLVNNPGTWSSIYWPLEHAEWHGWTPTDLIFPFFLFIVGVVSWVAPVNASLAFAIAFILAGIDVDSLFAQDIY